jgi:WD40 repeat protein
MLATCGWDRPVRLWEASTGKPIRQLTGTVDRGTFGVAFSPDGTKLASVSEAGLVRLWDVATGQELWKRKLGGDRTYSVAFFPDGSTFATAGDDGTVRIWDVTTSTELLVLRMPEVRATDSFALSISANGSRLACGTSKNIYVYNLETGEEPFVIADAHGGDISAAAFTPDGKYLASGGQSKYEVKTDERGQRIGHAHGEVRLWNLADGSLAREFTTGTKEPSRSTIALSPDGEIIAAIFRDKICTWNVSSGELLTTIDDYHNSVGPRTHGLAISPDKKLLAAIAPRHEVLMWDLESGARMPDLSESHSSLVNDVACSPDSKTVASCAIDGTVRLWDVESGRQLRVFELGECLPRGVHAVDFSADGSVIAAAGYDWAERGSSGIVSVWKPDGTSVWSQRIDARGMALTFAPDDEALVVAAGLGTMFGRGDSDLPHISIRATASGELRKQLDGLSGRVQAISCLADGVVRVVEERNAISTWNRATGEKLHEFTTSHRRQINSAAFSPDGKQIATSGLFDDLIILWDAETGTELRRIQVANTKGSHLAFTPNGKVLVSAPIGLTSTTEDYDTDIRFWNVSTGEPLANIKCESVTASSITVAPNGKQFITGMADGTIVVWNMPSLGN